MTLLLMSMDLNRFIFPNMFMYSIVLFAFVYNFTVFGLSEPWCAGNTVINRAHTYSENLVVYIYIYLMFCIEVWGGTRPSYKCKLKYIVLDISDLS
jgi:hypothetical protein